MNAAILRPTTGTTKIYTLPRKFLIRNVPFCSAVINIVQHVPEDKMSIVAWLLAFCLFNVCSAASLPTPPPTYLTRYDYLDIDKILSNERILRRLMDCIMERGPCTREGKELKRIIPDALRTNCSKCNDRQKMNTGRALAYLLHYKPEYWAELVNRFDQDGSFRKKLNIDSDEETLANHRKTRSIPLGKEKLQRIRMAYRRM